MKNDSQFSFSTPWVEHTKECILYLQTKKGWSLQISCGENWLPLLSYLSASNPKRRSKHTPVKFTLQVQIRCCHREAPEDHVAEQRLPCCLHSSFTQPLRKLPQNLAIFVYSSSPCILVSLQISRSSVPQTAIMQSVLYLTAAIHLCLLLRLKRH